MIWSTALVMSCDTAPVESCDTEPEMSAKVMSCDSTSDTTLILIACVTAPVCHVIALVYHVTVQWNSMA